MGANSRSVRSQFLGGESLLIDFGKMVMLSDHPPRFGGTGKGPMPGDLMKGALASSVVLALGRAGERGELPIQAVGAYCTSPPLDFEEDAQSGQRIGYLSAFNVDVVLAGTLTSKELAEAERIAQDCLIARALSGKLPLEESDEFVQVPQDHARDRDPEILQEVRGGVSTGHDEKKSPASARADYLNGGRAVLTWESSSIIVSDESDGVKPEDLLMGSLVSCTTVFAARAARRVNANVDIRNNSECELARDGSTFASFTKVLTISGDVNPEQMNDISFAADHCALGETLRREAKVTIRFTNNIATGSAFSSGSATDSFLPVSSQIDCDDGACCVADFAEKSSA